MKKAFFLLLVAAAAWSCSDKETSPDENPSDNTALCDSLDPSYDFHIAEIMNAHCSPCHTSNNEGGYNMSSYNNTKNAAEKSAFLASIKHEAGVDPMPEGQAKLSDSTIQLIECWINNGYPMI